MANYKTTSGNYRNQGAGSTTSKVQLADLVKTSDTTLENTDLAVTAVAGHSYMIIGHIVCNSSATPDSKFKFNNVSGVFLSSGWDIDTHVNWLSDHLTLATESGGLAGLSERLLYLRMHLIQCTTNGTVTLQFAQNTSNGSAATFRKGSYIQITDFKYI